jgi:hypothetical protein
VWSNDDGNIEDADITKITRMLRRLHFKSPMFVKDSTEGGYKNLRLYTTEAIIEALEDRARKNNDNLAGDVAKYAGATVIKNLPVQWVEYLDADTSNPLYAINHDYFFPFVMEGDFFRETGPMNDRTQKDVFTTFVDLEFNYLCTNRQRAGGMISHVAAA